MNNSWAPVWFILFIVAAAIAIYFWCTIQDNNRELGKLRMEKDLRIVAIAEIAEKLKRGEEVTISQKNGSNIIIAHLKKGENVDVVDRTFRNNSNNK